MGTIATIGVMAAAPEAGAASVFNPAGYVVPLTDAMSHQISLTVKVPTITCKTSIKAPDVINATISGTAGSGFEADGVAITMSCSGTTASYSAVGIVDDSNASSTIPVSPGDVISIAVIASTTFETASFADETSGHGTFINGTGFDASKGSVDVQGGSGSGHFPKFTPVTFTQVKLDNKPIGRATPTAFNQLDAGGTTQISASPLNAAGTLFTDKFLTNA